MEARARQRQQKAKAKDEEKNAERRWLGKIIHTTSRQFHRLVAEFTPKLALTPTGF